MVRNDVRRAAIADAGLLVLARDGARGLTHRAVDTAAGVPGGTTGNYFGTRDALVAGLVARIGERLAPDPAVLDALGRRRPSRALFADYIRDIVTRLFAERDVTLALFELRLDAARRPEVAEVMGAWLRDGLDADIAFNEAAGLPGERFDIALFHYALDGLMFDRLTLPIDPSTDLDDVVTAFVDRLLPRAAPRNRPRGVARS